MVLEEVWLVVDLRQKIGGWRRREIPGTPLKNWCLRRGRRGKPGKGIAVVFGGELVVEVGWGLEVEDRWGSRVCAVEDGEVFRECGFGLVQGILELGC